MTGKEFDKVFEEQVQTCRDIMGRKGPDYDDGKDRLSNFKVVAGMVGVDPKIVWAVYAAKHFLAIMNYCGKGKVESEPIGGRISDLINYGHLLNALEAEKTPLTMSFPHTVTEKDIENYQIGQEASEECDFFRTNANTTIKLTPEQQIVATTIQTLASKPDSPKDLWTYLKSLARPPVVDNEL